MSTATLDGATRTKTVRLEEGSRHALRRDQAPDAPDTEGYDDKVGEFGYVHSFESASRVDGPGIRSTLFLSGCLLRCQYCHNPDTWHMKDGRKVSAAHAISRLRDFAPALRAMDGGLTISGGEPLVQIAFTRRLYAAAKALGLHTALDTSGYLGARADDAYLADVDLVLLDIKSWDPATYLRVTQRELAPTLRFAERLAAMGRAVWLRYVLVPGLTDDPANIDGVARFVAPMRNVEWVEVLPFHQLGAFKWKELGIEYKLAAAPPCPPELLESAIARFRQAGCSNVR
ncbi:MAG TPA: pyruvate formate-lyase-activating protein [Burkholderiales bacterium]|nr:pyruvate formate-lyase-activating protein [Burkholderiales bacterium]